MCFKFSVRKYIYILNFGDYFARLSSRRVRGAGGYAKIVSFNTPFAEMKNPAGFVLSGSPNGSKRIPVSLLSKEIFATNFPVMGVCIGAQLINRYFGGTYKRLKRQAENGIVALYIDKKIKMLRGLKNREDVVMMHQDSITSLGKDFQIVAHTEKCRIAATAHRKWRWYTFQFHPELSPCGSKIFENFVHLCYEDISENKPERRDVKPRVEEE